MYTQAVRISKLFATLLIMQLFVYNLTQTKFHFQISSSFLLKFQFLLNKDFNKDLNYKIIFKTFLM